MKWLASEQNSDNLIYGTTKEKIKEYFLVRVSYTGYIDVDDGCWRPNVLMTRLRCW